MSYASAGECPNCYAQTLEAFFVEDDTGLLVEVEFVCPTCGYYWSEVRN